MEYTGVFVHTNAYDTFYIFSKKDDKLHIEISFCVIEYGFTGPVDFEFKHNRIILSEIYQPVSKIRIEYQYLYEMYMMSLCLTPSKNGKNISLRCVWKGLYLSKSLTDIPMDKEINDEEKFYDRIASNQYDQINDRLKRIKKCIKSYLEDELKKIIADSISLQEDIEFQSNCAKTVCLIKKSTNILCDTIDLIGKYI